MAWVLTYGTMWLFSTRRAVKFGNLTEFRARYDEMLVRTSRGWRIRKRRAGNFWWRGINAKDGDCPTAVDSLPDEVKAGVVAYMEGLRAGNSEAKWRIWD